MRFTVALLVLLVGWIPAWAEPPTWQYTTTEPAANWYQLDFDASAWKKGPGGFGKPDTPGARVGTVWQSEDIWLRRNFTQPSIPDKPALRIHHDEDAEVYVNGTKVASFTGYKTRYSIVPLGEAGKQAIRKGQNLLAVHCHQTQGGQYIDVQIVDAARPPVEAAYTSELTSRWAKEIDPQQPLPEYPRPQLKRKRWESLNGRWQYAIRPKDQPKPIEWDGTILVPYPVESKLSGVGKLIGDDNRLWYRRGLTIPEDWAGQRVLLHFDAVDWHTTVWVNGQQYGEHRGGYDPFTLELTGLAFGEEHELVLSVWDPTSDGPQPRGKQVINPGGIYYTPVTGIWQTVWLEPVPGAYIRNLQLVPDVDRGSLRVTVEESSLPRAVPAGSVSLKVLDGDREVAKATGRPGEPIVLKLVEPKLWSPDNPHLYDLEVKLTFRNQTDTIHSYFGMRKVSLKKDAAGIDRLALNDQILFQSGPLDQGWWPDGLYTAPTDAALRYDIKVTRKLGFNATRKHVKIEPARWYYWCDKLGLLVWQDMPSTGSTNTRMGGPEGSTHPEVAAMFRRELKAMIDHLGNHPSIVIWVPFNEGWGQQDTNATLRWVRDYDPTRLVDGPSGWQDLGQGDLLDYHRYPGPGMPAPTPGRTAVLSEFGGVKMLVKGHVWRSDKTWGYIAVQNRQELLAKLTELYDALVPLVEDGLSAAFYTQLTDVETEINGLLTYDRGVLKVDADAFSALNRRLYATLTPRKARVLVSTGEAKGQSWKFTTTEPAAGWAKRTFEAVDWQEGPSPFGHPDKTILGVRTPWQSEAIWLRRDFTLTAQDLKTLDTLAVRIHSEDRATVYLNGKEVLRQPGFSPGYQLVRLGEQTKQALQAGNNVLAVRCQRGPRPAFIDVGLVDLHPVK